MLLDNDKQRDSRSLDRGGSLSWSTCDEVAIRTFHQAIEKPFKYIYLLLLVICGHMGILKLHGMETLKSNSELVCSRRNCWVKKNYFYSVV